MSTITQTIAWTKGTTVAVSPPSVKSHAVLSGVGLTVNGQSVKSISIPRSAGATFDAAMLAGRSSVQIDRIGRGRPSTATTADGYAARLRAAAATPVKAPRKPRAVKASETASE